ncbi:hypothetical protein SeMB42_g05158 [Synchytrium endobioticum]|uniref:Fungal lipase-type domain-containing protein n=1 Tax=Synchytrium endobioticum TaxID=286115 RepID=A0A507CTF6_9FUNG|nr:hypothetical protein SeMB42_g05158 [Synchytrium endobioticum]
MYTIFILLSAIALIQRSTTVPLPQAPLSQSTNMKQQVDETTVSFLRHQARLAKLADCLENQDDEFTLIQQEEEIAIISILRDTQRTNDIAGYIGVSESDGKSVITVAFSSTRGMKDWIMNLNLLDTKPYVDRQVELCEGVQSNWSLIPSGARIHKGFYKAFEAVAEQIEDVLRGFKMLRGCDEVERVLGVGGVRFVGRSLGGAIASIASVYFANLLKPSILVELISFGSPRFANPTFASWMGHNSLIQSYRVVNPCDLLAHVPPRSRVYQHIPVEYFVDDTSSEDITYKCLSVNKGDEMLESPVCSNAVSWFKLGFNSHNYFRVEDCPSECPDGMCMVRASVSY